MRVSNSNQTTAEGVLSGGRVINDNELARLFISANQKSIETENAEIFDLFQDTAKVYAHISNVPSAFLREKIKKSILKTEVFHKRLLNSDIPTGFWSLCSYKFQKFFFSADYSFNKSLKSIVPVEWKYFSVYEKMWKKNVKLYINDFGSYTEMLFRNAMKFKQVLQIEFMLLLSGLLLFAISFVWNNNLSAITASDTSMNSFLHGWKYSISAISIAALVFLFIPYFLLASMWFMSINHLHKSKNFHYFLSIFTVISYVLFFVSIFNLFLYHFATWAFDLNPINTPQVL